MPVQCTCITCVCVCVQCLDYKVVRINYYDTIGDMADDIMCSLSFCYKIK